nr:uncharacterized protein PA2604-like [Nerophis lumbriciformis]
MNYTDVYASPQSVANAPENARTSFYRRTYLHVAAALAALIGLEAALLQIPGIENTVMGLLGTSKFSWLIVLGAFMGVSWLANKWAFSGASRTTQYAGLSIYVVAQALIFLPLILIATSFASITGNNVILQAGVITLGLFGGLTFIAFTTKKDFSFLGGFLKIAFFIAIGLIVASIFFGGFSLGLWFSGAMILVMGASILYQTSNIIHHFGPDQHVAASLGLFASIATLFWYVLQFLMQFTGSD